jgi:hypothetical protein
MALTHEQIEAAITAGVRSGTISWAGFRKDGAGRYMLPVISEQHQQIARAIEAEVRKDDEALIMQMLEALCECAEDSQEQLDRMDAARMRDYKPKAVAWQEKTIDAAKVAINAARARLDAT